MDDRLKMWCQRWDQSKIGWHKNVINEHLLKYYDYLKNGKEKIKILFPLSGKSLDLVHCYNEGHTVIGIEGVALAVEAMFENLPYERTFCSDIDGFIYKSADSRLIVFCCDFFKMKPELLGFQVDAVFDRGAFEAIYEKDRQAYVDLILQFVQAADFRYILNVYEYQDEVFKGPPRACPAEEVYKLFNTDSSKAQLLSQENFYDYGKERWNIQDKNMKKCIYGISNK